MSKEKAIELLKKLAAYADISWYKGSPPKSNTATFYYRMRAIERHIEQALAEIEKQPVCKICGGSRQIKKEWCAGCNEPYPCKSDCPCGTYWKMIPCPDCRPEPTEFGKSFSRVLDAVVIAFATMDDKIIQRQVQGAVDWGRKAKDLLDWQAEEAHWIPVSERLPESRVKVLTLSSDEPVEGIMPAVAWMGEQGQWWTYGNNSGFYKPTHWKPIILPEQALKR